MYLPKLINFWRNFSLQFLLNYFIVIDGRRLTIHRFNTKIHIVISQYIILTEAEETRQKAWIYVSHTRTSSASSLKVSLLVLYFKCVILFVNYSSNYINIQRFGKNVINADFTFWRLALACTNLFKTFKIKFCDYYDDESY